MSYTDSPVNPTINISVDPYYYCHVYFGLVEWYLDKSGLSFNQVFHDIDTMMQTVPKAKIDFNLVEEGFELWRDDIKEFDVVDNFWTVPLSISDSAMPEDEEGSKEEEEYSMLDLCTEVVDENTDHRHWKFGI